MGMFDNLFGAKEQPPQYAQPNPNPQQPVGYSQVLQPVQPTPPPTPPPVTPQPKDPPQKDMIHKKIAALEVLKQLKMKRAIIVGSLGCLILTTLASSKGWLMYVKYGGFIVGFAGAAIFFMMNERFAKTLMTKYRIR